MVKALLKEVVEMNVNFSVIIEKASIELQLEQEKRKAVEKEVTQLKESVNDLSL